MSKPFFKTFFGNLIIVSVLSVALYWIFFGSLSIITRHNDVKVVPDIKNKSVKEAIATLDKLGFEIVVDSVYDATIKPLTVIDQLPIAGSTVKTGRKVILTVNRALAPLITVPNFNTMSLRTALLALKRNQLELGDTTFQYDISYNTVLEMRINGKPIKPGIKVPIGTRIDFVISAGLSDVRVKIPYLLGRNYHDIVKELDALQLKYVIAFDESNLDTAIAKAYVQIPEDRNEYGEPQYLYQGEIIDIRFKKNPEIPKRTFMQRPVYDNTSSEAFDQMHNQNMNSSDSNNTNQQNPVPSNPRPSTDPNNKATEPTPVRPDRNATQESEAVKPVRPTRTNPPKPDTKPKTEQAPKENKPLRPSRN